MENIQCVTPIVTNNYMHIGLFIIFAIALFVQYVYKKNVSCVKEAVRFVISAIMSYCISYIAMSFLDKDKDMLHYLAMLVFYMDYSHNFTATIISIFTNKAIKKANDYEL